MIKKTIIICISLLAVVLINAGELTLDAAVNMAFNANVGIKNAADSIAAAKSSALTQGTFLNPEGSVEFFKNNSGAVEVSSYEVSQQFEQPGVLQLKSRIASNQVNHAKSEYLQTAADVYLSVVSGFYGVSYAKHKAELAGENLEYMRRLHGTVEQNYRSGKSRKNELQRVKISMLEAEKGYLEAMNDYENEISSLNVIMGRDPGEPFDVFTEEPLLIPENDIPAVVDRFISDDPGVKQAELAMDSAEGALWMEQLRRLPAITAGVTLQKEGGVDNYTGILGVNFPLWNLNQGEAGKSGAEYEITKNNLWLAKKQGRLEALTLAREIKLASKRLDIARKTAESANEMIVLAQQMYMDGKLDLVGYYDQMKAAFESKSRYYEEMRAAAIVVGNANKYMYVSKYFKEKE